MEPYVHITLVVVPAPHIVTIYRSLINQRVGIFKFLDAFSDENECLELYFYLKFAESNCKKCGRPVVSNYVRISRKNKNGVPKKCFRCRSCHTHIYPLSDTIFANSAVSLRNIFYISFMISDPKNGISALEITRQVNISYKTAHRVMILIRSVLNSSYSSKMKGVIEIDEAFIGKGSKIYNWSGISPTGNQ